jgi:phosphoglucomutase
LLNCPFQGRFRPFHANRFQPLRTCGVKQMDYRCQYELWLGETCFDEGTREELRAISADEKEIEDRFYRDLEFGTGGMRGIMGAGTNRMNRYTVRKASQGLANHVIRAGMSSKGVVIAYDPRNQSPEFAEETALVMAGNGIRAYLFESLRPTPELSFAVRHLGCAAGVVVTASHNPKEYNGYKVYSHDGCQLPPEESDEVISEVNAISDLRVIPVMDRKQALEAGLLSIIGSGIDDAYMAALKNVLVNPDMVQEEGKTGRIVFTPLHGSGNLPVRRILKEIGFEHVLVVPEQECPDPSFSTVKSPNPEEREAFTLAIALAAKEDVDVIIGTDPDADRIGVVVRNTGGDYVTLTGNQTGCLLMEYILSQKKARGTLPVNSFVVKTIVTTELSRKIAARYGVELIEVLTGFKFIGEQVRELDDTGLKHFQFGYEESYGYLAGTHARDKDAVVSAMLIAEMYLYFRKQGKTLYDALQDIYRQYGDTVEAIDSFTLKGKEGVEVIDCAMAALRDGAPQAFGRHGVAACRDYQRQVSVNYRTGAVNGLMLPQSNVLYYEMRSGDWFCIRPSGTEPKIKIYFGVSASSEEAVATAMADLRADVLEVVKPMLAME